MAQSVKCTHIEAGHWLVSYSLALLGGQTQDTLDSLPYRIRPSQKSKWSDMERQHQPLAFTCVPTHKPYIHTKILGDLNVYFES